MTAHATSGRVVSGFAASAISDDDPNVRYSVDATDGWINASESCEFGQDVFAAMSPADARWMASKLLVAADVAERHPRWNRGT